MMFSSQLAMSTGRMETKSPDSRWEALAEGLQISRREDQDNRGSGFTQPLYRKLGCKQGFHQ